MTTRRAAFAAVAVALIAAGCWVVPSVPPEVTTPPGAGHESPISSPTSTSGSGIAGLLIETFDDPAIFGGPGSDVLEYPVSAGDGFAILGRVIDDGTFAIQAQAWLSPDGRAWERVRQIPSMDDGQVVGLTELTEGTLLAVGSRGPEATVWTSGDHGRTWTAGSLTDAPSGTNLAAVVSGRSGALALGVGPGGESGFGSRLWWSPNGREWEAVAMRAAVFGRVEIRDIAATSSGFVAIGGRTPAEPTPDPLLGMRAAAWWSDDGLTWALADVEDGSPLAKVYAGSEGLLAVGYEREVAETVPWQSTDGRAWRLQNRSLQTGNRYPAVWGNSIFLLGSRFDGNQQVLELTESRNGIEWRIAGEAPFDRTGAVGVAAPGVPGIIQVGGGGDGRVWLVRWPEG